MLVTIHSLKLKNIYNKKGFRGKCRIYIIEGINYPIIWKDDDYAEKILYGKNRCNV